jgi:hypothetical protein
LAEYMARSAATRRSCAVSFAPPMQAVPADAVELFARREVLA